MHDIRAQKVDEYIKYVIRTEQYTPNACGCLYNKNSQGHIQFAQIVLDGTRYLVCSEQVTDDSVIALCCGQPVLETGGKMQICTRHKNYMYLCTR